MSENIDSIIISKPLDCIINNNRGNKIDRIFKRESVETKSPAPERLIEILGCFADILYGKNFDYIK